MTEPCPRRCGHLLRGPLDACPNPACMSADLAEEAAYDHALEGLE